MSRYRFVVPEEVNTKSLDGLSVDAVNREGAAAAGLRALGVVVEIEPVWGVAWREGYNAEDIGKSQDACPYAEGDPLRDAWLAGFQRSEEDRRPARD